MFATHLVTPMTPGLTQSDRSVCGELKHAIYRSFDELADQRQEWDEFVADCGGDLYSSFDWCRIWWDHYGESRSLEIHLFRSNGAWTGLLATFRESLSIGPVRMRLIRLVGCDHSTTTCAINVRDGHASSVLGGFASWLHKDSNWDMILLGPLAGYFSNAGELASCLNAPLGEWRVEAGQSNEPHIFWELPGSFDEFVGSLSKKERSNIKIARKRTADAGAVECLRQDDPEFERWFAEFVDQHQRQWQAEGMLGHFDDWPRAREFHNDLLRAMAPQNRLKMLRLTIGGETVGFQYGYRFANRLHWLLGSRDPDPKWDTLGPGRVLLAELIERAIGEGCTAIDGLRGMYEYKLRMGGQSANLQFITLVRNTLGARWRVWIGRTSAKLLNLFYYRVWFGRLAPMLKVKRSGLRAAWIRTRI